MYEDNGVNEFATVCNVTFRGMELAGSFTKNTAKAFFRIAKFLMAMGIWGKNVVKGANQVVKDWNYRKSGKKSQKIMKDKFQGDILYGKVESVKSIAQRLEVDKKTLTEEQMKRLPDDSWIEKRFEQLAKKHGLEYCYGPNLKGNALFIQYPKQQEVIYQEIVAELQQEIKDRCEILFREFDKENEKQCEADVKQCKEEIKVKQEEIKAAKAELQSHQKIKDKVGESIIGEKLAVLQEELNQLKEKLIQLMEKWNLTKKETEQDLISKLHPDTQEAVNGNVIKKITPVQYLEQSGLLDAPDNVFDEIMRKHFPEEYAEVEKAIQQNAGSIKESYLNDTFKQKQKQDFVRQINTATRMEAKKNGVAIEVEVPVSEYVKNEEKSISFPHPEYPEFMITVPAEGLCGYVDDSNIKKVDGKVEGSMKFSVYKDAEVQIRVPVMDKISGKVLTDENGKLQFINKRMSYEKFSKYVNEVGTTAAAAMIKKQRELQKATRRTVKGTTTAIQKGKVNVKKP